MRDRLEDTRNSMPALTLIPYVISSHWRSLKKGMNDMMNKV